MKWRAWGQWGYPLLQGIGRVQYQYQCVSPPPKHDKQGKAKLEELMKIKCALTFWPAMIHNNSECQSPWMQRYMGYQDISTFSISMTHCWHCYGISGACRAARVCSQSTQHTALEKEVCGRTANARPFQNSSRQTQDYDYHNANNTNKPHPLKGLPQ